MASELSLAHRCVAGYFRCNDTAHELATKHTTQEQYTHKHSTHKSTHTTQTHTNTHTHDSMYVPLQLVMLQHTVGMCLSTSSMLDPLLFQMMLTRTPYTLCSPSTDSLHSLHPPCAVVNTCIQPFPYPLLYPLAFNA